MKEAGDIAGIALPFAAGTAAFTYLAGILAAHSALSAAAFLYASVILLGILILLRKNQYSPALTWTAAGCCMLMCGALAASTESMLASSMHRDASWLAGAALDFGKRMQAAIDSIPFKHETTNQIIKALLTGEKSGIPEEVSAAFRNSGASHILALSGLHLGLIYGVVHFVTRCIGNTPMAKAARSAILVCACGFYTLATGAGASIVRAFIFIIIGEYARLSGRNAGLRDVMMAALLIHLSITPSAIKEPGFQLSYAAIAGIAYIFPWMQGFWPGNRHEDAALTKCARWVWDSAAMSISCQITTGPLAYMYFGTFPAQFILTNMIALPLTGIIIPMALAVLAACSMGWELPILIDVTEWMITALCGSLDLLSTM